MLNRLYTKQRNGYSIDAEQIFNCLILANTSGGFSFGAPYEVTSYGTGPVAHVIAMDQNPSGSPIQRSAIVQDFGQAYTAVGVQLQPYHHGGIRFLDAHKAPGANHSDGGRW